MPRSVLDLHDLDPAARAIYRQVQATARLARIHARNEAPPAIPNPPEPPPQPSSDDDDENFDDAQEQPIQPPAAMATLEERLELAGTPDSIVNARIRRRSSWRTGRPSMCGGRPRGKGSLTVKAS